MIWKSSLKGSVAAGAVLAAAALAACGGGGGGTSSPVLPGSGGANGPLSPQSVAVKVLIKWPTAGGTAPNARVRPAYVSNGTKSATIVANGTSTEVDNPNLNLTGGSAGTQTSTVTVSVPPNTGGATTAFTVNAFDKLGGVGNLLGSGSTSQTITAGVANAVAITLNGNLGAIACQGVAPFVTPSTALPTPAPTASSYALALTGAAGNVSLVPLDPDGYTIIMPGSIPTLSLAPMDATNATATAAPAAGASAAPINTFAISVVPAATAETFKATGTSLGGAAVSTSCVVTRSQALYTVNNATGGGTNAGVQTVTVHPALATGAATPIATLAGANTMLVEPQFPAVDPKGDLFVSNQGPMPNATYGPNAGYVSIYGPAAQQSGNATPIGFIPNLNRPEGVDFDKAGNLYVMSSDRITVYPPTANGVTAPAVPSRTIVGSNTGLFTCYGMHVVSEAGSAQLGQIYIGCSNVLYVFKAGATGNVAPQQIIGAPTGLALTPPVPGAPAVPQAYGSFSWLDAAADSAGTIYAPASNNNLNMLDEFAATATNSSTSGNATPSSTVKDANYSQPLGIFVTPANPLDASDAFYVSNFGNNSVEYYSSATTLQAGVATNTITGAGSGIVNPFGVTVR